jgi:hypothetical protein
VKIVAKCEDCGRVLGKATGMRGEAIILETLTSHHCPARLRKQFGVSDVEGLALAMYDIFHNHDMDGEPGWTAYRNYRGDAVVEEFRNAAEFVAGMFSHGRIGSIYYKKDTGGENGDKDTGSD